MPSATVTSTFPASVSLQLTSPAAGALSVSQLASNTNLVIGLGTGDTLTLDVSPPQTMTITPVGQTTPIEVTVGNVSIVSVFMLDKLAMVNYAWPGAGTPPVNWGPDGSSMQPPPGPWPWPQFWPPGAPLEFTPPDPIGGFSSVAVQIAADTPATWVGDYLLTLWGTIEVSYPPGSPAGLPTVFRWCSDPEVLCQSTLAGPGNTSQGTSPSGPAVSFRIAGPSRSSVSTPAPQSVPASAT